MASNELARLSAFSWSILIVGFSKEIQPGGLTPARTQPKIIRMRIAINAATRMACIVCCSTAKRP